jgi:hypothetical protein
MKFAKLLFSLFAAFIITGCAHTIVISPDISKIERDKNAQPIQKNVGYYIVGDREKEVVTPGGGGDKVTYKPYKDIEAGFHTMLTNVFKNVYALKSDKDVEISKNDLSYIIALEVTTNSSSPSLFTWPPTIFDVTLNCNIKDERDRNITSLTVTGDGRAEFDEFKSDYGLAGKRATQDALIKLQRTLLDSTVLRDSSSKVEAPRHQTIQQSESQPSQAAAKPFTQTNVDQTKERNLKELKRLYDAGLISKEIYLEQQKAVFSKP